MNLSRFELNKTFDIYITSLVKLVSPLPTILKV